MRCILEGNNYGFPGSETEGESPTNQGRSWM